MYMCLNRMKERRRRGMKEVWGAFQRHRSNEERRSGRAENGRGKVSGDGREVEVVIKERERAIAFLKGVCNVSTMYYLPFIQIRALFLSSPLLFTLPSSFHYSPLFLALFSLLSAQIQRTHNNTQYNI